jgi:UDP-glucose:(heptosyl)LPS alpha-1,3-glucosyltransferase
LRVSLVILHADPARGGAERYTRDLAAGLVARGHRVSLLAATFADVPAGVATVPIAATGATRVGRFERFLDGVDRAIGRFDVVHAMLPVRRCDVYHPHAGVAAEAVAAGGWAGHLNRRRVRFAAVERRLFAGASPPVVLCLSGMIRSAVRRHYPEPADDRLATLFNGTDLTRFDPAGPRADLGAAGVAGLMLAQDFARKGLREAIQAVRDVPGWTLVVGGRDDARPYVNLAATLGVADRVRFLGPVADAPAAYRAADFFILPTRHDPCSLVVLEALAMGVPVISTRQNGACEAMVDSVHGRVLPSPGEGLADAVRDVIARRVEMSAACLALRPALSQEHHLDKLEQVYRDLVARRMG